MADLGSVGDTYGLSAIRAGWLALGCTHAFSYPPQVRLAIESKLETYSVSGTVRDDTGTLCVRRLLLVRRVDGRVMDATISAADGTYTMKTGFSDEHDVIALDDVAGTVYNDLIARATPG